MKMSKMMAKQVQNLCNTLGYPSFVSTESK